MIYKILAINPGSTSTKIGLFENEQECFTENIMHDAAVLQQFSTIYEQYGYRKKCILNVLSARGISLSDIDAFVGRGGGLVSCPGGTYEVNNILYEHAKTCHTVKHPAALGPVLAHDFALAYQAKSFVVNPPDVDEMQDVARITGLSHVFRRSRFHALNQKQVALLAAKKVGKSYCQSNFVIAHIGGGISVTAHYNGKCIDTTDIVGGDGAFAPTRAGQIPAEDLINLCYSGQYTKGQMMDLLTKTGGLVHHLQTSDLRIVARMVDNSHPYATLLYEALGYQIAKSIGAYSTVLYGNVDAIVLTGGMSHDKKLVSYICEMCNYIAPIWVYPGEHELYALASGAFRVLSGQESAQTYTGVPVFQDFLFSENRE